jgi:uncharacterized membrane protein
MVGIVYFAMLINKLLMTVIVIIFIVLILFSMSHITEEYVEAYDEESSNEEELQAPLPIKLKGNSRPIVMNVSDT